MPRRAEAALSSELRHRIVTVPIDDPGDLIERLPDPRGTAWVRRSEGLVGWGVAASWEMTGEERFSRAQRWWSEWCRKADVEDPLLIPGSGPVAFASFTFDPDPQSGVPSCVVVPRVVLGRRNGQAWLTVVDPVQEPPLLPATVAPVSVPLPPGDVEWSQGSRSAEEWQAAVTEVIHRINSGEVDKVVLARDVEARVRDVDARYLLRRLAQDYPECWTFSVGGLVGATPELLVRRTGDLVVSRVLAGTVKRRGDETVDDSLAAALLGSGKDLEEHEYAVHSVARALAAHCTDLDVPTRPHVLRLANVQHLATDVTGSLADDAPVLALAAALHPTAAVCGTPTERAFAMIRELEGMDRGRYAGPVGWFDSRGDGEFGIALRCAEVSPEGLRLFAGCGIVAGSDPDSELAESRAKFVPIREALDSPAR
ncbi:MAG: isochorismate synthase MenF [bacterium]